MAKRRAKKIANSTDAAPQRLRRTLAKCAKAELINILVELAGEDRRVLRRLAARIELESPPRELAAATRQAIADATDFDERDANRNFSYDYEAYSEVQRNLTRLIDLGELRLAMELSAGVDEGGQLSGRNERRGIDDRRHSGMLDARHSSSQERAICLPARCWLGARP